MSSAPHFDIDLAAFWQDPYPTLARLRAEAPIAYVPQLDATVFARWDDISQSEKNIAVFSSEQPQGLMNRLMGRNLMRKDGAEHRVERKAIFPAVSREAAATHWQARFQASADEILDEMQPLGRADLVKDFALRFSAECLKEITGLTNMPYARMDACSQGMIDGISNYVGDPEVEARCHAVTAEIDAAIDERMAQGIEEPDFGLLAVLLRGGMAMENIRANIKLAISGGQNEPRDAIAGTAWALLTHPDQLAAVQAGDVSWLDAFEEFARWISPIGMSPRRIAKAWQVGEIALEPEDKVFLLFGSANRDEAYFESPDEFDVTRDTSKSMSFGAGPHFCAGAWASRTMIADVALPSLFTRLTNLRLKDDAPVPFGGWAFRGPLSMPVAWDVG